MKKLSLSMLSMFLLSANVNALQQPSINVDVNTSSSLNTDVNVKTNVTIRDEEKGDDPLKTKTFTKSFSVDKNDKINLSNQYGSITVKTWDKNEIKVDVEIKAYAKTADEAQELLDQVSINATKDGDIVSYKTNMADRKGNWGSNVRNGKVIWRREVKVYYAVYMPAINSLTASQSYGHIIMDDFSGPTSLKVQYGNLVAGDLKNANNYVNVQYGKANLKDVNAAKIKHQYGGGLTLTSINDLELEAQYTAVNIGTIKNNAQIKHQYGGGIVIGYVGSLSLTAQYTNVKIDKLAGIFTGKVQYGKLAIANIEAGCKIFNVDTDYSSVDVGFATSFNASFNVNTKYGGFNYGNNVSVKSQDDGGKTYNPSKSYSGQIGKGGTANVNIKADYGSVTFK